MNIDLNEETHERRMEHLYEENEYLKEFISLLAPEIQEDIFDFLPDIRPESEQKAFGMWPEIKEICGISDAEIH